MLVDSREKIGVVARCEVVKVKLEVVDDVNNHTTSDRLASLYGFVYFYK